MVQYVLKRTTVMGKIAFELPENQAAIANIKHELTKCKENHNDFVLVTFQPPKKPRTTGKESQNHHLNGHIMQICNETGNDYDTVKSAIKMIAVEQMGYPYKTIAGIIVAQGERECSTEECAKLIEASHILAADLGIILQE
ncbi:hypothetical protein [Treponema pectinovorum]|uniref:hypothetical protein n=1 Tax=Treponema pectinovorum TaxID=164 RepID=UPI0011CC45AC|nr:hypothetical protein [Treponema pectinovorum]